ncbi:MAG: efflux RND transporter periplasmic adaptor subunit [Ardenticatenales bacterium]
MNVKPRAVVAIVVIALVALLAWSTLARSDSANAALTASGTIEADEVNVAAELGGRVTAVEAREGDAVNAGDVVVRLDPALLDAQRAQAAAAAEVATQAVAAAQAAAGTSTQGAGAVQLAAARAQASAAASAVRVLDVQATKLTVRAPITGVVLARAIEPGEIAGPGATLLVIGRMDDLSLKVFVPEDRYGNIDLGQTAEVRADAFGSQIFDATVTHIDETAQFTPRNVQTVAGRRSTVYGIRLRVVNKRDRLKPGMPADVTFDN